MPRKLVLVALGALLSLVAAASAQAASSLEIKVLSNRADLISGGEALVEVKIPDGTSASSVQVFDDGRDVTSMFARRLNGRYEGVVTGLSVGPNVITARAPGLPDASVTVANHPNGGPVFSGPQVQPWVCQSTATDSQCNQPPTYAYQYKSSVTGQFAAYDPQNPPSDVAQVQTDNGHMTPYIVRIETGYQDRDQYKIAVLFDPAKPWTAWAPQRQFNHSC